MKIIPLQGYDIILGMDWLGTNSPMHVHWQERWMQFTSNNQEVKLQGLLPDTTMGPPVSHHQLQAFDKVDSILYLVQLYELSSTPTTTQQLPQDLQQIIQQFSTVFDPPNSLPPQRSGDHKIPLLEGAQPFCRRPYRYNPAQKTEIEKQIREMLDKGWIQTSTSPYSSPVLLVQKKTGDWRLCVDFRRLNALTVKNKYPLPIIEELLEELQGATWFTTLDLCSGFHQI
jgi:ribulose bisphosphate carboxylase small subunit